MLLLGYEFDSKSASISLKCLIPRACGSKVALARLNTTFSDYFERDSAPSDNWCHCDEYLTVTAEQEQADLARPAKRGTALARVHGLDAPLKSHTALLRGHAGQRVSVSAVSPVDPIQSRADDTLVEALVKPFAANLSAHEHAALARLDSDGEVDGPLLGKHGWASKICSL